MLSCCDKLFQFEQCAFGFQTKQNGGHNLSRAPRFNIFNFFYSSGKQEFATPGKNQYWFRCSKISNIVTYCCSPVYFLTDSLDFCFLFDLESVLSTCWSLLNFFKDCFAVLRFILTAIVNHDSVFSLIHSWVSSWGYAIIINCFNLSNFDRKKAADYN